MKARHWKLAKSMIVQEDQITGTATHTSTIFMATYTNLKEIAKLDAKSQLYIIEFKTYH